MPDARISANFVWWFETKTSRGRYSGEGHDRDQVRRHAEQLEAAPQAWLFVLTPDPVRPAWFAELDGVAEEVRERVLWLGFRQLAEAVMSVTSDAGRLIGEQARFLLTELVALYEADGLLASDDAVVVAARVAWPEYLRSGAYVCQPQRAFREGVTHLGFYAEGAIQHLVPRIRTYLPSVPFTRREATDRRARGEQELGDLIDELLTTSTRAEGDVFGVVMLTGPKDRDTVVLPHVITNDTVTSAGRRWAWTLGQRYTWLERLRSGVRFISEL